MAQKNTQARRLTKAKLAKTDAALTAIKQLPNYKPQRTAFGPTQNVAMMTSLQAAQDAEQQALSAYNAARDAANKAEWDAYNFSLTAAEQVMGQYGSDSDEYASLGYKKKSEYKKTQPGKAKKNP